MIDASCHTVGDHVKVQVKGKSYRMSDSKDKAHTRCRSRKRTGVKKRHSQKEYKEESLKTCMDQGRPSEL